MPRVSSSLYPLSISNPNESSSLSGQQKQVILRLAQDTDPSSCWRWYHQAVIAGSSLFIVGSIVWVPIMVMTIYKKWKALSLTTTTTATTNKRRKALYAAFILMGTWFVLRGPHRRPAFAERIGFRSWKIWQLWCQFVALEVWKDSKLTKSNNGVNNNIDFKNEQNITAIAPHGIFPFGIGIAGIPALAEQAFGKLRIMVASATYLFPLVRDIIHMVNAVDASKSSVHKALVHGDRIALIPGGIPEMFQGYPKPLTHPDDEYVIIPKGFIKMALQHNVPVIPVYCFGITKLFKRLMLPEFVERISLLFRISICIFYGVAGLPVPFRQHLKYVIGDPILHPTLGGTGNTGFSPTISAANNANNQQQQQLVDQMHQTFCEEMMRLFESNKEMYGWNHKTLHLITR